MVPTNVIPANAIFVKKKRSKLLSIENQVHKSYKALGVYHNQLQTKQPIQSLFYLLGTF